MSWLRAELMERLFLPANTEVQERFETSDEIARLVTFVWIRLRQGLVMVPCFR